jgi:hypothetical protein
MMNASLFGSLILQPATETCEDINAVQICKLREYYMVVQKRRDRSIGRSAHSSGISSLTGSGTHSDMYVYLLGGYVSADSGVNGSGS